MLVIFLLIVLNYVFTNLHEVNVNLNKRYKPHFRSATSKLFLSIIINQTEIKIFTERYLLILNILLLFRLLRWIFITFITTDMSYLSLKPFGKQQCGAEPMTTHTYFHSELPPR